MDEDCDGELSGSGALTNKIHAVKLNESYDYDNRNDEEHENSGYEHYAAVFSPAQDDSDDISTEEADNGLKDTEKNVGEKTFKNSKKRR